MEPRNVLLYFVDIFATLKPCIMMYHDARNKLTTRTGQGAKIGG